MFKETKKVKNSVIGLMLLAILSFFVIGSVTITVQVDRAQDKKTEYSTALLDIEEITNISWVDVDTTLDSFTDEILSESTQNQLFSFKVTDWDTAIDPLISPYFFNNRLLDLKNTSFVDLSTGMLGTIDLFSQLLGTVRSSKSIKGILEFSFFSFLFLNFYGGYNYGYSCTR